MCPRCKRGTAWRVRAMGNVLKPPTAQDLLNVLDGREWYSYSTAYLLDRLKVDVQRLQQLVNELDVLLRARRADGARDHVNIFVFHNVQYVGLESRRLAYEKDKLAGTNHVERLIQAGAYRNVA